MSQTGSCSSQTVGECRERTIISQHNNFFSHISSFIPRKILSSSKQNTVAKTSLISSSRTRQLRNIVVLAGGKCFVISPCAALRCGQVETRHAQCESDQSAGFLNCLHGWSEIADTRGGGPVSLSPQFTVLTIENWAGGRESCF